MRNLRIGFTLSEVLITLGVIGVVAAITLPIIHSNIQNHILRNQFKKAYSNLLNLMNLAETENGTPYVCGNYKDRYKAEECDIFWENVFRKYKIIKTCNYKEESCSPKYKTREEVLAQGGTIKNKSCTFLNSSATATSYFISDGSVIILSKNQGGMYFALDINGINKPNKWGYDVFYLMINRKSDNLKLDDYTCPIYEKGGNTLFDMFNH